jgi:hypothetical protein
MCLEFDTIINPNSTSTNSEISIAVFNSIAKDSSRNPMSAKFCGSCCEVDASSDGGESDGELWAETYESGDVHEGNSVSNLSELLKHESFSLSTGSPPLDHRRTRRVSSVSTLNQNDNWDDQNSGPNTARQKSYFLEEPSTKLREENRSSTPRSATNPFARQGVSNPTNISSVLPIITAEDKSGYDTLFERLDKDRQEVLSGAQAVQFFSESKLDEHTLAIIWDLANVERVGYLTKDEFAIAMHLIRWQRGLEKPEPIPASLPKDFLPQNLRTHVKPITPDYTSPFVSKTPTFFSTVDSEKVKNRREQSLALLPEEKRAFGQLFRQADVEELGVIPGERAVKFFAKTAIPPHVLGNMWQIADVDNKGLLTPAGFAMVLRLIGHYQAGHEPTPSLAFLPGPLPKLNRGTLRPETPKMHPTWPSPNLLQPQTSGSGSRIPPLTPEKADQYAALFDKAGAQDGILPGEQAKQIFERAGVPIEIMGRIWSLADSEKRGSLNVTEFVIAMHLLASFRQGAYREVPSTLPAGLYEAATEGATRNFNPQGSGDSSSSVPPLTPGQATMYVTLFNTAVRTSTSGLMDGLQAKEVFERARLPRDVLGRIWNLVDTAQRGTLDITDFIIAMHLIKEVKSGSIISLPNHVPANLLAAAQKYQGSWRPAETSKLTDDGSIREPRHRVTVAELTSNPFKVARQSIYSRAFSEPDSFDSAERFRYSNADNRSSSDIWKALLEDEARNGEHIFNSP